MHKKKQREYFKNRKSPKWRELNSKFQKLKRKYIREFYIDATKGLKTANPSKFYSIVKKIGCLSANANFNIEEIENLSDIQAAEKIADYFANVSNQYKPVDFCKLPAYLPSPQPPQVSEADVYLKLKKLKNTKSTHPLDLPNQLRQEYDIFLVDPLKNIINQCLSEQILPDIWKIEYVTPLAKVNFTN